MSLKKLGRYELVRVLGRGAMGVVYEGHDPTLGRKVAIKTVKVEDLPQEVAAEYDARFRNEARAAARLQHPHIVSVYDADRDIDIAYLVMEYVQGDDLKRHLDRGTLYSLEQTHRMIRDLLSALDYAHRQGILHRDIKPANLLIEPGGQVKLADFGVARFDAGGDATRTQGGMVGTLKYMSPEQVQGEKTDARSDLFSVGVMLYQLLTGKRPFDGDNDFSIMQQINEHAPLPPSSLNGRLPPALDAVLARALAKDREQRFATARDFAAALQAAVRRAADSTVMPPADPSRKIAAAPSRPLSVPGPRSPSALHAATGVPATGESTATVTQALELVCWKEVSDANDAGKIRGFLDQFPAGTYADPARRRLRELGAGPMPPLSDDEPTAPYPPVQASVERQPPSTVFTGAGRKPLVAILGGLGAVAVATTLSFVLLGPKGEKAATDAGIASEPVPARLSSQGVPPSAYAVVVGPPVAVASPRDAATALPAASGQPRPLAQAIVMPQPVPVGAVRGTTTPATASRQGAPAPAGAMAANAGSRDAAKASRVARGEARLASPAETCKDKMFLAKPFCLQRECANPVFYNDASCVKVRAEARVREEGKLQN